MLGVLGCTTSYKAFWCPHGPLVYSFFNEWLKHITTGSKILTSLLVMCLYIETRGEIRIYSNNKSMSYNFLFQSWFVHLWWTQAVLQINAKSRSVWGYIVAILTSTSMSDKHFSSFCESEVSKIYLRQFTPLKDTKTHYYFLTMWL